MIINVYARKKKTTLKQVKSYLFDYYIDIVIYCPLTYYLL